MGGAYSSKLKKIKSSTPTPHEVNVTEKYYSNGKVLQNASIDIRVNP
jgi:hypothetical protein